MFGQEQFQFCKMCLVLVVLEPLAVLAARPSEGCLRGVMRVLVCVDSGQCSEILVDFVGQYCWPDNSSFLVLTVESPLDIGEEEANLEILKAIKERQQTKSEALVNQAVESLKGKLSGHELDSRIESSHNTAEAILEAASDWKADLIVIGSHNKVGIQRLLIGSVSSSVMLKSTCSVHVVKFEKQDSAQDQHVLVALDQSEYADRVIDFIADRPWPSETKFKFFSVAEGASALLAQENPLAVINSVQDRDEMYQKLHKFLGEKAGAFMSRVEGANVEIVVKDGDPREVILAEIEHWPARQVILGSRGKSNLERILLGSVSHAVMSYSPCNVEVVK